MSAQVLAALLCFVLAQPAAPALQRSAPSAPQPTPATTSGGAEEALRRLRDLEAELAADHAAEIAWLARIALELQADPGTTQLDLRQQQVATIARLRAERIARRHPSWPDDQADRLLVLMLVDGRRFAYDADFRANVFPVLRDGLSPVVPMAARRHMARQLKALEYGRAEQVEVAWGLAPRRSRDREVLFGSWPTRIGPGGTIRASVYSLPSRYVDYTVAAEFLRAVHRLAPQRSLVVICDAPLSDQLRPLAAELPLRLLETFGRLYSPWPRDPMAIVSPPDGPVTLVTRPNLQAKREGDVFMSREIVHGLPDDLDEAWGQVRWTMAPIPFHGGHTLATPGTTWASVHTLLPRVIELMDVYPTPAALDHPFARGQFIAVLDEARAEFEAVFGQPLRFVHEIPAADAQSIDFDVMLRGGGAYDLDSLVTILPDTGAGMTALVADLDLGRELLAAAPNADLVALRDTYRLGPEITALRTALLDEDVTPLNPLVGAFLDSTASYLERQGLQVRRIPLLEIPTMLLHDVPAAMEENGFLITWNNVVIETVEGAPRAEGFSSGLTSFDDAARRVFTEAGYEMRYLPVLALSVIRGGGYRCASNHVRE